MVIKRIYFFILIFILIVSGIAVIRGRFKNHITNQGTFVYCDYNSFFYTREV